MTILAMCAVLVACSTNAPAPGEQLERDGESPVITDPGGVANQLTNEEISDDDASFEDVTDD